ncbi:M1 family metallopeptidase [Ideonella sp. B7]|uniref:M1 family metallopeptidase n=1 Tax=Ideonella benzenivorans TaxID=2831643 RepID=UPI001CEDE55E|nr:M1 family metallopeptidase [Ideonella benzenivorans]MCA6215525.1 M1 family metallopeptidase [Ideonella benzenivorans]
MGLGAVLALTLGGALWWQASRGDDGPATSRLPDAPILLPARGVPPSPDGIALAPAHAGAVREPSAATAWGGPRRGDEPTLSDRVVRYQIEARLDPDRHTVEGRQQLTWRNRSDRPVQSVYLHLYLNAFEGEGSTFMTEQRQGFSFRSGMAVGDGDWGYTTLRQVTQGGQAVPWRFVQPDGGPVTDHTVVRLDLPQAVGPGASTTLAIDFFDQLPRVLARTGYFGSFHLVGQWFPKIAVLELPGERGAKEVRWNAHEFHLNSEFYADYGLYDVKINVPQDMTVGAVGELQGAPVVQGGRKTYHFMQGDVHDFAWTADRRYAKPLTAQWTGPGSPPVTVTVLYPPEYQANAQPVLQATLDSLTYFSRTLGPYPYRTVTAVIPPYNAEEAGGMEYPTFFTAEGYAHAEPGTWNAYNLDFVTIHEFGHGYFYGLLGSNEFEEPMLDEGLNEYWDLRMIRDRGQPIALTTQRLRRLGWAPLISAFDMERLMTLAIGATDALGENSWDRYSSAGYGSVYGRTATALRDLEATLGRATVEKAFRVYYERWKYRHPAIGDLQAVLAEVSGRPEVVKRLFEQQVYAVRAVDDRVESLRSEELLPAAGWQQVQGRWQLRSREDVDQAVAAQRQAWRRAHPGAKSGLGPFPWQTTVMLRRQGAAVPQTVRVHFADGHVEQLTWDGAQPWQRFRWVWAARAVSVEIDPEGRNRLDNRLLDNSRRLEADGQASRRWAHEIAVLAQTLFALVTTL